MAIPREPIQVTSLWHGLGDSKIIQYVGLIKKVRFSSIIIKKKGENHEGIPTLKILN